MIENAAFSSVGPMFFVDLGAKILFDRDMLVYVHSILSTEAIFTLVIAAFVLNVLVPVTITLWRPRYLRATTDTVK